MQQTLSRQKTVLVPDAPRINRTLAYPRVVAVYPTGHLYYTEAVSTSRRYNLFYRGLVNPNISPPFGRFTYFIQPDNGIFVKCEETPEGEWFADQSTIAYFIREGKARIIEKYLNFPHIGVIPLIGKGNIRIITPVTYDRITEPLEMKVI